jgi:hypothetical protein
LKSRPIASANFLHQHITPQHAALQHSNNPAWALLDEPGHYVSAAQRVHVTTEACGWTDLVTIARGVRGHVQKPAAANQSATSSWQVDAQLHTWGGGCYQWILWGGGCYQWILAPLSGTSFPERYYILHSRLVGSQLGFAMLGASNKVPTDHTLMHRRKSGLKVATGPS